MVLLVGWFKGQGIIFPFGVIGEVFIDLGVVFQKRKPVMLYNMGSETQGVSRVAGIVGGEIAVVPAEALDIV